MLALVLFFTVCNMFVPRGVARNVIGGGGAPFLSEVWAGLANVFECHFVLCMLWRKIH